MIARPPFRALRSLTFRLALFYLANFTLSVLLLVAVAYWVGVWRPLNDLRATVEAEAGRLTEIYPSETTDDFVRRLERLAAAPSHRQAYYALVGPDGRAIATNLPNFPAPRAQRDWRQFEFETFETGEQEEHEALARDLTFADGVRLLVGRDTQDLDEREDFLSEVMIWGWALTLAMGCAGGLLMSRAVERRLERINATARRVIAGDLSDRIALQGSGDDFDQLAETLNRMLARIEDLVQSVSRVSDSIAHELRTPLARLHGDLDTLATALADDPSKAQMAWAALAEAERLRSTFDALLRIARIETGRHEPTLRDVDLAALIEDAVELYEPAAQARGQTLTATVERPLAVKGDADLLFQAASNLLDNAIKFTPTGGAILVAANADHDGAGFTVSDNGPGVATADLGRVTERFFRAPATAGAAGLGLGLSLVLAVAGLHRGRLELSNLAPGFRARLRLPRDV